MKILYYFMDFKDAMHQWQHYHIIDELAFHNIEITVFNPLQYDTSEESNEHLLKFIKNNHFDLFMTPVKDGLLFPETIQQIKILGLPTLLICFDSLTVPFNHRKTAALYDLVWLTSKETEYLFKNWGANSVFLPYAANPNLIIPQFSIDKENILFIGTPYGSRCHIINKLIKNNIPVSLYGNVSLSNYKNFIPKVPKINLIKEFVHMMSYPIGRKLAYASILNKITQKSNLLQENKFLIRHNPINIETMMMLYSKYALSLSSVTNRHTGVLKHPVLISNLRSFEIPAAGGLLFSQYNPELDEYFHNKREAIYYYDDYDMVEKAKYYLSPKRQAERLQIKISARKKVELEHNWYTRFSVIFQKLNIK